jgi:hypothetical protein
MIRDGDENEGIEGGIYKAGDCIETFDFGREAPLGRPELARHDACRDNPASAEKPEQEKAEKHGDEFVVVHGLHSEEE